MDRNIKRIFRDFCNLSKEQKKLFFLEMEKEEIDKTADILIEVIATKEIESFKKKEGKRDAPTLILFGERQRKGGRG